MNKLVEILIIIGIIILGVILIGVGLSLYEHITTEPKVVNEPPVIKLNQTNINATIGDPLIINATTSDDGTITTVIWDLESGPQTNFTQIGDDLYFTPQSNGTYIFKLEVQDDKNLITTIGVQIIVKVQGDCEPDERLVDGKCVEIPRPTCTENQVYNATDNVCYNKPAPPKPVCTTSQVYNPATNKCDPKPVTPVPTPTPTPQPGDIKVAVTADVEDSSAGNAVFSQIQKINPNYVFVLGDLGYESDLKWFKSTYGTLGDKMWCVVGNHEADNEDGSSSIEKETLNYCGNTYWIKRNANLFVMINTNDKQETLISALDTKIFKNSTVMTGVKAIHINGHKGCATPPNSHHPAGEIKALCDFIKSKIPTGVKAYFNSGHNHILSESADKVYKQSGAGGKSHYTCGTSSAFPYCDNTHWGFLLYTIKADGTVTSQFIDGNGVKLR